MQVLKFEFQIRKILDGEVNLETSLGNVINSILPALINPFLAQDTNKAIVMLVINSETQL